MKKSEIGTRKSAAIALLLTGKSQVDVAAELKMHRNVITAWMHDEEFLEQLHDAEHAKLETIARSLIDSSQGAMKTLNEMLNNPLARDSARVRSADILLGRLIDVVTMLEFNDRLTRLERALNVNSEE